MVGSSGPCSPGGTENSTCNGQGEGAGTLGGERNTWGLHFGEEDVRELYRCTKTTVEVKAELLPDPVLLE